MSSAEQSCLFCHMPSQGYAFCSEQCRVMDWDRTHEASRSPHISALASMLSYSSNIYTLVPHSRRTVLPYHHQQIPPPEERSAFSSDSSDDSGSDSDSSFWESPRLKPQTVPRDPSNILRARDLLQKYVNTEAAMSQTPPCQVSCKTSATGSSATRNIISTRQLESIDTRHLTALNHADQDIIENNDSLATSSTNINEAKEILKKYLHVRKVHPEVFNTRDSQKASRRRSVRAAKPSGKSINRSHSTRTNFNCIEGGLCENCNNDEEQPHLNGV